MAERKYKLMWVPTENADRSVLPYTLDKNSGKLVYRLSPDLTFGHLELNGVNISGYFILSQYVGKHSMIPRRRGRIVNVASIAGLGGNPPDMKTIAYNTSKGAVVNFTRALAAEWGRYGIRVNAICPGFFPSKMTRGTLQAMGEERLASHAPLQRLGDDEDLKGTVVLFASDAGKHITGQWLAVDGGVSVVTGG